jgi:elongation of very long chain fatty acids protein 6
MAAVLGSLRQIDEHFSFDAASDMMNKHWHYSIYISIFYVVSIFSIQRFMQNRERYDLRRPLFLWSLLLSVFSAYGFWVCGLTLLDVFYHKGWKASVCDRYLVSGRYGLWAFLFCFSKAPELVDTYFIVLRKQKLIFLHWYHHITVFMYCWYHFGNIIMPAQWFISMNYFVHSIMYFYYAVRASGLYRPPVWVNIFITSLQLLQMIVGVCVNVFVYRNMSSDPQWYCDGRVETTYFYVYVAFAMYFSYFLLFANFFYSTYVNKSQHSHSKKYTSPVSSVSKESPLKTAVSQSHSVQDYWTTYSTSSYYENESGQVKQRLTYENKRSSLASAHGLMNIGMVRH